MHMNPYVFAHFCFEDFELFQIIRNYSLVAICRLPCCLFRLPEYKCAERRSNHCEEINPVGPTRILRFAMACVMGYVVVRRIVAHACSVTQERIDNVERQFDDEVLCDNYLKNSKCP